jgi:mRNA interferase RelE/StbE
MKVLIDKSFEKDANEITDKKLLQSLAECIREVQKTDKLTAITNCKKLKGYKNAYRISLGKYRLGFIFENQTIQFIRFLHRSKIYQKFPD